MEQKQYPHAKRGIILALLGGISWGFSANCADVLMGDYGVSVEWLTCIRMITSAAVFLVISVIFQHRKVLLIFKDMRSFVTIVAFAIFGLLLTLVSYLYGIRYAGVGPELIMQQLGMIIIVIYLCICARRAPHLREILGVIFALVGVLFISTQGDLSTLSIPLIGLIWGLLSAVSLFFYNVLPVKPLAKYGSFLVIGLAMLIGSIVACLFFQPWEIQIELPMRGWLVFAGIIIIGSILAYMFFVQGIKDAGPMRTGILGSVEPVSGIIISALWLHTEVSLWDILGTVFIVVMIVLVAQREDQVGSRNEQHKELSVADKSHDIRDMK